MTCKKRITFKKAQICSGDLNKQIDIQYRVSVGTSNLNVNTDKPFVTVGSFFAAIKTTPTSEFFDDVTLQQAITTDFYIRYTTLIDIFKEIWIEYNSRRFKVTAIENINEDSRFIRFRTIDRGSNLKEASKV